MDRMTQRAELAGKSLATLFELAGEPYSKLVRDASIQRFEYSFEAVWKAAHRSRSFVPASKTASSMRRKPVSRWQ